MFDSVIRAGAVVDRAILDKEVIVGPGAIVGEGPENDVPNRLEPSRLNTGITVVGKRAVIPRGVRIGRNVRIDGEVRAVDFPGRVVRSGETVQRRPARTAVAVAAGSATGATSGVAAGSAPGGERDGSEAPTAASERAG
jgi:ADP-glucose pyrophosphorylase